MIIMPIFSSLSSHFTYAISLDGTLYNFNFYWNTRDSAWYMDILDNNNNMIHASFKLVVGYALLTQWQAYAVPPGQLIIYNLANNANTPLNLSSLGSQYMLLYITKNELVSGILTGAQ